MADHRSYSQTKNFRTCGEQYRLERVEKAPQRPNCTAVAGNVIHVVSEWVDGAAHIGCAGPELYSIAREVTPRIVEEALAENISTDFPISTWKHYGRPTQAKPNGEDMYWWIAEGIPKAVDAYIDWRVDNPAWRLAVIDDAPAIEVGFDIKIGTVEVRGKIDRIFQDDSGRQLILDIKSGQKPKTDEQLGTYWKATGIRWGAYLYGLKTGEAKYVGPIDLSHWTDDKLEQLYCETDRAINAGIFIPNPGDGCFHCAVQNSCKFGMSAI
jgi:hypothetical protein